MRIDIESIFPLGLPAIDKTFVGRSETVQELSNRIMQGHHTWIQSQRGWGKDSLIGEAIRRLDAVSGRADLLSIHDADSLADRVRVAIESACRLLLPARRDALAIARGAFSKFLFDLRLTDEGGYAIHFTVTHQMQPDEILFHFLGGIDHLSKQMQKRTVLVLDHFQNITTIRNSRKFEFIIRDSVNRANWVTYIATAPNPYPLEQTIGDPTSSFYKLMTPLVLNRIEAKEYSKYLKAQSKRKWKKALEDICINEILTMTNRHPYYVNLLCRRLWQLSKIPSSTDIPKVWDESVLPIAGLIRSELSALAPGQRAVLQALADQPERQIVSAEMVRRVRLAASSIQQAVRYLEQKGYVFRDEEDRYTVVDPAFIWVLKRKG